MMTPTFKVMTDDKIILCDLDGTLADCSHRIHLITGEGKKDWTAFFAACGADKPISHICRMVNSLSFNYQIWITSGRSDECRVQTEKWLLDHEVIYDRLIMRAAADHTDDSILKPRWLEDGTIPKEMVAFAIDDRQRVVDAWRAAGIPCLQVAPGDF